MSCVSVFLAYTSLLILWSTQLKTAVISEPGRGSTFTFYLPPKYLGEKDLGEGETRETRETRETLRQFLPPLSLFPI